MKRSALALVLALASACPLLRAETAPPAWAHNTSDLKPDPATTWGGLPNGFRYVIMTNNEPKDRVSVRLYVDAGSIMEEDSQQGLAHFLEHMAFNGTEHFKAGEMKAYFERMKMSFGADTNAHTSFKETVYKLELPEGTEAYLKDAFTLMHDYASGMLLAKEEIESERGVILSEKLARDSVDYRITIEGYKFALPDSVIPKRLPIGDETVIRTAPRDRFVEFYKKWYTPDRMIFVVVGPVKPAEIEERITKTFSDLKPGAQRLPDPDLGKVTTGAGLQVKLQSEKEAGEVKFSIDINRPSRRRPDNAQTRAEDITRGLADSMLNRRLEKLSRAENAPFLSAQTGGVEILRFVEGISLELTCQPAQWEKALAAGEQELRRALEHGFSAAEFAEAKANLLTLMDNAARQATTRRSQALANEIVSTFGEEEVFTHPESDLERVKSVLAQITPEKCLAAMKQAWNSEDIRIFAGGNLALEDGPGKIKEAFLKSRKVPVQPLAAETEQTFAYTDFGPPGTVVKREDVKDVGITLVTFANNVRLNLMPTEYAKDTILVNANFGAGRLTAPKDKPGLETFATYTFDTGALEKHSADDLERLLAGRTASLAFSVDDNSFALTGKTNRKDLLLQCQYIAAQMTAPGYREEGARQVRQGLDALFTQIASTPEGMLKTQVPAILHNNDTRFVFGKKEDFKALSMADVRAWLAAPLQESFLEVAIVGDFNVDDAIKAVAATLGALPKRPESRPDYAAERKVAFGDFKEKMLPVATAIPKGIVGVYWPTKDRRGNIKLSRQMNVVAAVLDDLVLEEVREKLGDSYSPDVHSIMSDTFEGDGSVAAYLVCEGKNAAKISKIVVDIAAKLAAEGATQDQVDRAKGPLIKTTEDQKRNNTWWMNVIASEAQSSPERLEWVRTMASDYNAVTVADVNSLAKQYLGAPRAKVIKIVPVEGQKTEAPEKTAPKPAAAETTPKPVLKK